MKIFDVVLGSLMSFVLMATGGYILIILDNYAGIILMILSIVVFFLLWSIDFDISYSKLKQEAQK